MRRIVSIAAALLLWIIIGGSAFAEAAQDGFDYGREQLEAAVPETAAELLEEGGITPENGGALSWSFTGVLTFIWDMVKERAVKPLKLLVSLCGVVLLCAMANSIADTGSSSLQGVFSVVGVLAGAGIAVTAVWDVLNETLTMLSGAANFILVFIPIFTAVTAVLGHALSATAVNAASLAATQLFSQLAVNFLAPMCGAIMGLSVTGAIHPQLNLAKLGEIIKKFVVWGLTLIMTVFMSILSAQTVVAASSDNTFIRTAKFMVSSGVPIVGGTISDAVNTVQGSLELLKGSIGTYGIIAAAAIILPTLITVGCYKLSMMCARSASEIFGLKELSELFKSCESVMAIILAVQVCFLLLNTFAVIILLVAGK